MYPLATVDPGLCIACRACEDQAPGIFRIEEGVATVIGEGPAGAAEEAEELCPTGAIAPAPPGSTPDAGTRSSPHPSTTP